jgi:hypothetical protein
LVGGGGNSADLLGALGNAAALVVGEEEEFVLDDWAAEVAAEDVADELAGRLGSPLLSSACLLKKSLATVKVGRLYQ